MDLHHWGRLARMILWHWRVYPSDSGWDSMIIQDVWRLRRSKHCTVRIPRDSLVWRFFRPALRCMHFLSRFLHVPNRHSFSQYLRCSSKAYQVRNKVGCLKSIKKFCYQPWMNIPEDQRYGQHRYQPRAALSRQRFLHSPNGTLSSFPRIGTWFGCVGEPWEEFPWSFGCIKKARNGWQRPKVGGWNRWTKRYVMVMLKHEKPCTSEDFKWKLLEFTVRLCICIYIYIDELYIYIHMYTCICMRIYIYIYVCMYMYIYIYVYLFKTAYVYIHIYICIKNWMCIYIYIPFYYIYIYIHTTPIFLVYNIYI